MSPLQQAIRNTLEYAVRVDGPGERPRYRLGSTPELDDADIFADVVMCLQGRCGFEKAHGKDQAYWSELVTEDFACDEAQRAIALLCLCELPDDWEAILNRMKARVVLHARKLLAVPA